MATWQKRNARYQKSSINFQEWRKECFTFYRSFSNFESHKFSRIRPKFEKTTKLSISESFWYFIRSYSQDKLQKLLQTSSIISSFACIHFCDWQNFSNLQVVSLANCNNMQILCALNFCGETAKLGMFIIFYIANFFFLLQH